MTDTVTTTDARRTTKPSSRRVWIVLSVVAVGAFGVLATVWIVVNPTKDTLWYEVARTSLQVLGVAVIGGIVTFATSKFQQDRQNADQRLQEEREKADQRLERRREEYDRRAALLARTSQCAQKMFVTCQHVRRVQGDHSPGKGQGVLADAQALLDQVYREFSAEAQALEMELGARYGIRMTIEAKDDVTGEAYLRWHQISDLLTLYYFALCKNFRKDVLKRNSVCHDLGRHYDKMCHGELHSGLELKDISVGNCEEPTESELRTIRRKIRPVFNKTMPVLASAILSEKFMVIADDSEVWAREDSPISRLARPR